MMSSKTPPLETIGSMYKLNAQPAGERWTLEEAYAFCRDLTTSHYENFPVGSLLVPKEKRPYVYAIYAFARISDDFADEAQYEGRRLDYLNGWDEMLSEAYEGRAEHPVFMALADAAEKCELPIDLFQGLLRAFKQDVTVKRYETLESVIESYCQYSANPVGRLILHLFDYRDEELFHLSDCICTALQLTNFWQDVAIDLQKDRIYIPKEMMREQSYTVDELFAHVYDARFQRIMKPLVERTWALFDEGYPLLERVRWPLNAELRFTWLGGATILSRTRKSEYNVFEQRPKLSKWDYMQFGGRALFRIGRLHQRMKRLFQPADQAM
ncbi:MAG: squalene synthase HpnC [Candidatus Hinthialibacter sp.]